MTPNTLIIPKQKTIGILIGFPILSTLLSLLLLERNIFDGLGLDFFSTFWFLILGWYLLQIFLVIRVIKSEGYSLAAIGYRYNLRQSLFFIMGYLIFAFALFFFVEFALSSAGYDAAKLSSLSDFSNLTPKTTTQRLIFIFAGLAAGISEEIVYRGFAIEALKGYRINQWVSVLLASIPFVFQHGLKSIDQFWWFLTWGIIFGALFIVTKKRLHITIIIHWLVILSAMLAILQVLD